MPGGSTVGAIVGVHKQTEAKMLATVAFELPKLANMTLFRLDEIPVMLFQALIRTGQPLHLLHFPVAQVQIKER